MGLHKGQSWLPAACLSAVVLVLGALGQAGRDALAWSRPEIASGELWRLFSGHFVHLGTSHLVLNLVGLWLVWYLVADTFRTPHWLAVTACAVAGIDLGFWLLEPRLVWYVGLSGVLHALLAAGVVAGLAGRRRESPLLAAFLLGKIVYEQLAGPLPGSEGSTGGPVIVDAHLYGALSGLVAAGALLIRVRAKASI